MKLTEQNKGKMLLRRLICVPKCASCKERLLPFAKNDALDLGYTCLCAHCMERWQKARAQMCHTCSKTADACTCMPIKKTFAQPSIPSLFFYHPDTSRVESRVIYTLKHKNHLELFEYVCTELHPLIESLLDELEISKSDCIMTYIPRTKRALKKNGFDQGEVLCCAMAKMLGIKHAPLLIRVGGSEQKKLSGNDRKINASRTIFANTELCGVNIFSERTSIKELLEKKTVLLIEDVITTGATVGRAIRCLKDAGASNVVVCSVARSEISSDKKKQPR